MEILERETFYWLDGVGGLLSKLVDELVGLVGFYGAIFLSFVGY